MKAIGAILLVSAGIVMIPCFVHWLITPPRKDLQTDFKTLTERNKR